MTDRARGGLHEAGLGISGGGRDLRSGTEHHAVFVEAGAEADAIETVRRALEGRGAFGDFTARRAGT